MTSLHEKVLPHTRFYSWLTCRMRSAVVSAQGAAHAPSLSSSASTYPLIHGDRARQRSKPACGDDLCLVIDATATNSRLCHCRHIQRIEARLRSLEQVVGTHLSNLPESCRGPSNSNAINHFDLGYMNGYDQIPASTTSHTNLGSSLHDEGNVEEDDDNDDVGSQMHPEDPTDGMGHFVFEDEEDRAFFGLCRTP